jgi:hypothetical protein
MSTIRSTSPDAYIIFFPYVNQQTQMGVAYSPTSLATKKVIIRTDLISVQTTKNKGGAGNWSASVAPGENYKSQIQPGSWCMIFMADHDLTLTESPTFNNGQNSGMKMLGIVRSVRAVESMDPSSGVRTLRYEFAGDDFHSVLDAQVYINPELRPPGNEKASPLIDSEVYFKKAEQNATTPSQMVSLLTTTLLGQKEGLGDGILSASGGKAGGVYGIPPALAKRLTGSAAPQDLFVNVLNLALQQDLMGQVTFQPHLSSGFTLWSMLEQFANKVVNEIYTELLPQKIGNDVRLVPTLVLRAIPFTSSGFSPKFNGKELSVPTLKISKAQGKTSDVNNLYTSRFVGEDEVLGINYGKSDSERFNFFFVSNNFANDLGLSAYSMAAILGNADTLERTGDQKKTDKNSQNALGDASSVARHGLRPFFAGTIYAQLNIDHFFAHNIIVRDMWSLAYLYDNGQVSLVGTNQHIPVGTNIEFKDRGWIAHVEAVSNSFSVAPSGHKSFRTNISFVRLQKFNGTPIDFDGDAKSFKEYQHNITKSQNLPTYNDGRSAKANKQEDEE